MEVGADLLFVDSIDTFPMGFEIKPHARFRVEFRIKLFGMKLWGSSL